MPLTTQAASKFGIFFQNKTGVHPADCENILEIEAIAESTLRRPLKLRDYPSALVASRSLFFVSENRLEEDLNAEIDNKLDHISTLD